MSALSDAARDYLRLHNKLGHELAEHHGELDEAQSHAVKVFAPQDMRPSDRHRKQPKEKAGFFLVKEGRGRA